MEPVEPGVLCTAAPYTAAHLNALLRQSPPPHLTRAEGSLLTEWLDRLSNAPRDQGQR